MGPPIQEIPPPLDPGIPVHKDGHQGRLFRINLPVTIPNRPDVVIESGVAEIFIPDTDKEYEPFPIASYDLKGFVNNQKTNTREPVIITVNCSLTFWPPTRPGVEVPPDFVQRAIQSNTNPDARIELGSTVIDELDIEVYPDKTRTPVKLIHTPSENKNLERKPDRRQTKSPDTKKVIRKLVAQHHRQHRSPRPHRRSPRNHRRKPEKRRNLKKVKKDQEKKGKK